MKTEIHGIEYQSNDAVGDEFLRLLEGSKQQAKKDFHAFTKHRGRFFIPEELFQTSWKELMDLFGHILVIECAFHYYNMSFEYVGYSKFFDKVEDGMICPTYDFIIIRDGDKVTFKAQIQK